MPDDFCPIHGYEHMQQQFGNPIPHCEQCETERMMFKFDMTEDDLFTLQSAVENMRSAPEDDGQRARILDARWRLASKLEDMAKRADQSRRVR